MRVPRLRDVLILGGGPAGLSLAALCAKQGLDVLLLERNTLPCDKPCGEGLMPSGVRVLEAMGVRHQLQPSAWTALTGLKYVQEDGSAVEGLLPHGGGLGVRRTELSRALLECAKGHGATVTEGITAGGFQRDGDRVMVDTRDDRFEARMLVAADGLHSPTRAFLGWEKPLARPRRFGMRRHFAVRPWTSNVEVHFCADAEAYFTPVGNQVGVAFLWDDRLRAKGTVRFEELLARFPSLPHSLRAAASESPVMGAGPLERNVVQIADDRIALLGDAAGYVDAITGEGVSLALASSELLARLLPEALRQGCSASSLRPYVSHHRALFRQYSWLARSLLSVARRPQLRRFILNRLVNAPGRFEFLLRRLLPA
jgi:flavin-dependent dehydrogenase